MEDISSDAAEDQPGQAGASMGAHHDEVGIRAVSRGKERGGGITISPIGLGREPGTLKLGGHVAG